jgi:hypothetical protein
VATQHPQSRAPEVDALLSLQHPTQPTKRLPLPLRRLLPDPLRCFEDLQRFTHVDLVAMTRAQRDWEALRIRTAAALVDDSNCVPTWLLGRLERLAA